MAARTAALKIDWAQVTTSLGLRGQTVAALHAFKKRNDDVRRKVQQLSEQPTTVDFAAYRAVLKNRAVVDEIEKRFAAFKPATYDVSRQLKAIDAFEVEAVKNAEATKTQVDLEIKDLQATLRNIEEARPFDELTVEEVATAEPSIDEKTSKLVSKGRWTVPGYKASCTSCATSSVSAYCAHTDSHRRRNSATCRCYKQLGLALLPLVYASIVDRRIEPGQPVVEAATSHVLIWRWSTDLPGRIWSCHSPT
ncbi:hypothetical protein RB595_009884 [Gaeumannomyces hyphopodioides]